MEIIPISQTTKKVALGILLLATGLMGVVGTVQASTPVRVMPLGDSITDGYTTPGGYRAQLWNDIRNSGLTIDFVGSQFNGPGGLGDHDHEGHPGWTIGDIDAQITGWMSGYNPQIVLLQIGTNDINRGIDPAHAPARLSALVDHICARLPAGGKVYVAQITPESDPNLNQQVIAYNNQIPGMVQSKQSVGQPVYLVDMYHTITTGDIQDGVHPTAAGYNRMGDAWFNTIQADLVGNGGSGALVSGAAYSLVNQRSGLCLDVTGPSMNPGTRIQQWGYWGGPGQRWRLDRSGNGAFLLTSVYSGQSLDNPNGSTQTGTVLQQFPTNGSAAQQYRFVLNADGSYTITNVASGLCLDDPNGSTTPGAMIQLWIPNGLSAQRWYLQPVADANNIVSGQTYTFANLANNLSLDDPGATRNAGTQVQLWGANGADAQQWRVDANGANLYTLTNIAAGLRLDDPNGSSAAGTIQQLWYANDAAPQNWLLRQQSDGNYLVTNQAANMNLEFQSSTGKVQLWPSNAWIGQRWKLIRQ